MENATNAARRERVAHLYTTFDAHRILVAAERLLGDIGFRKFSKLDVQVAREVFEAGHRPEFCELPTYRIVLDHLNTMLDDLEAACPE